MGPLEVIGGIIALGLMGGGLKLYQIGRKRPEKKIEQPPSPRVIDEDVVVEPEPVVPAPIATPITVAKTPTLKRKNARRSRKKK